MRIVTQLTAILPNRPGALADLLDILSDHEINVLALCVVDTAEHGLVRLVVDEAEDAKTALEQCGMPFGVSRVIAVELQNTPGALGELARRLGKSRINIDYVYGSALGTAESAHAMVGVSNLSKAARVLKIEED